MFLMEKLRDAYPSLKNDPPSFDDSEAPQLNITILSTLVELGYDLEYSPSSPTRNTKVMRSSTRPTSRTASPRRSWSTTESDRNTTWRTTILPSSMQVPSAESKRNWQGDPASPKPSRSEQRPSKANTQANTQ